MNHEWILNEVQGDYFCKHCGVYAKNDAAYYATCSYYVDVDNNRAEPDTEILRQLGHYLEDV